MKISILTTIYPQKGISIYSDHLIKELEKTGLDAEIICFKKLYPGFLYPGGQEDNTLGNGEYNYEIKRIISWYNPFSWILAAMKTKGDVVHVQWWSVHLFPVYFVYLLLIKFVKKKIIIITVHNVVAHENRQLSKILNKIIFSLCGYFIVHNNNNKKSMAGCFNIAEEKIGVIPFGVYKNDGYRIIDRNEALVKLALDKKYKYLLFFGHIREYKGLDILLESMKFVTKKNKAIKLIIAGTVWGSWNKYQKIIDQNGIEDFIIKRPGFASDKTVSRLFSASDLVVMPYKFFDSSSGLLKTALFFEKPLMVTDVGDLGEVVKNPDFIAKPNNAVDLTEKITAVINNDEKLDEMKKRIIEIKDEYSWEGVANSHLRVYNSMGRQ